MLWTDAKIERLIELYRSFEFLYNPKLKDHKNRVKGQLAWQTIAVSIFLDFFFYGYENMLK